MRSTILAFILVNLLTSAFAQELQVPDYDGVFVADLAQQGTTKEKIFRKMQERLIKFDSSICANRAHMWAYDFFRFFQVDSAKIFIFYTPKTSRSSGENWWYHVAPVVNEGGAFYAMDRAFMDQPVTVDRWLQEFNGSLKKCYEIKNGDTDLLKYMYTTMPFPSETAHGKYDCYYKIAPVGIWFPVGLAFDLLGTDQKGAPINFKRNERIPENEVLSACMQAYDKSTRASSLLNSKKKCESYLQAKEPGAVKLPL
jgi:Glutaminase